jgi:ABC-2 type transport system ATP-binding protein
MAAGRLARATLAVLAAALVCSGSAAATSAWTQVTIDASDGTPLACAYRIPTGTPPAGGWPGVILFHGLGGSRNNMKTLGNALVQAGFASLACDARGTGDSGGKFGFDGPNEVQDAHDLFDWFAARSDVSDTEIGALGRSLGGGEVWNAAAAGVPFKAIVPVITWTSLGAGLSPSGVPKAGLLAALFPQVPASQWDPSIAQARGDLLAGTVTSAVSSFEAARSAAPELPSLTVPTLMVQGRHDFLFDMDQAFSAYDQLAGPRRLYLGDLGHSPSTKPVAEHPTYLAEEIRWFRAYLAGGPAVPGGVVLAHDPWDGRTSRFTGLPLTRHVSVNLPGTTTLLSPSASTSRSIRLTSGSLETFGDGSLTVHYSTGAAGSWPRLIAEVFVRGNLAPVTVGGALLTAGSGVVHIPLSDQAVLLRRGEPLRVVIGPAVAQSVYGSSPSAPAGSSITIGAVTLNLSVLRRPVSR